MRAASRRDFVRLLTGAGLLALAPSIPRSGKAQQDKLVDETDPMAQSLGYRHDASAVDPKAFPKRSGARGSQQFCHNCALYAGEPSDRFAPCSIFQNRHVTGSGWCNAWVAKS